MDIALLAAKAPRGVIRSGDQTILLGEPLWLSGFSEEKDETSVQVLGKSSGLKLEAKRAGRDCTISVNDEVVHQTQLGAEVAVRVHIDPARMSEAQAVELSAYEGRGGSAALGGAELLSSALGAMAGSDASQAIIASALGGEESDVKRLFPIAEHPAVVLARVTSLADSPLFSPRDDGALAYAAREEIDRLLGPSASTQLDLELFFASPPSLSSSPPDLLRLRASEKIEGVEAALLLQGPHDVKLSPSAVVFEEAVPLTREAAQACFLDRLAAMRAFYGPGAVDRAPFRFENVALVCSPLASSLFLDLSASAEIRREIRAEVTARPYGHGADRGGWDGAFTQVAAELAEDPAALAEFVNPSGAPGPEADALENIGIVRAVLTSEALVDVYLRPVVSTVFQRMFDARPMTRELANDLAMGIQRAGASFTDSTLTMIGQLRSALTEKDALSALKCARDLDDARIGALGDLFSLAAGHPSLAEWLADERGSVLQNCHSLERIATLRVSVLAALDFARAEDGRIAGAPFGAEHVTTVVSRALDEGWTSSTFSTLEDILGLAAVSNRYGTLCASPSEASMVECVDGPAVSALEGGALSPAYEGRYGRLAKRLTELERGWFSEPSFFSARYALEDAFFSSSAPVLWGTCDNGVFDGRVEALFDLLGRMQGASTLDVVRLQDGLSDLLEDCGS